ncbi:SDR family NAD(P)-dependent oxidoreductase [Rhizobium laguerreae]|uniref:SDR family NAD(P)-dependent oxidoreductase n=2 Tax=Rhizobium laguerreae TaxID=1076926 RepID=UPI002484ADE2|nr:SDR family oxidoreductase [Rhizobium laguerreae]
MALKTYKNAGHRSVFDDEARGRLPSSSRGLEKGSRDASSICRHKWQRLAFFQRSVYCASKAGLVGFTRAMAIELAQYGIRVNALGPTFIDSPLARRMFEHGSIASDVLDRIPIGRLGTMAEVAAAVVFLASDGADLVTGHHLLTDGGWRMDCLVMILMGRSDIQLERV